MDEHSLQSIASRIRDVLRLSPDSGAIEYEGDWTSWAALDEAAAKIETLLEGVGISRDAPVGWVARNHPSSVAVFVSLLLNGRPIAPLRSNQPVAGLCEEIRTQRLTAVIADASDWQVDEVRKTAAEAGSAGLRVSGRSSFEVSLVEGLEKVGSGPHRPDMPGMVIERLSSGTTGPPKRIMVTEQALQPALRSAEAASSSRERQTTLTLKTSPSMILKPLTHAAGIFGLLFALYQARPIVLFEKFDVATWLAAVERHKPRSVNLVPTMIRMILSHDVPDGALASLSAVHSGTAPLDPETQQEFEQRFNVPVLIDYGAAEFIGGVAGWSLSDHHRFAEEKRGSVGRPRPDVELRVADAENGAVLDAGRIGQLEIRSPRFGRDWIRIMDLASLDEDGFLYIHGRADDAINRGGFKVLPEEVAAVLRRFPGVCDAAVMGVPHDRLGEVPVAVIEASEPRPDPEALKAFAREYLAAYQVPVEFHFVEALPRTTTMKVSRPDLRALLGV